MYKKNRFYFMIFFVGVISSMVLYEEIYAAPMIKNILIEPNKKEFEVGSPPIALKIEAEGKSPLKFKWELIGDGQLREPTNRNAVIYIPPNKIEQKVTQAIISVIVFQKNNCTSRLPESVRLRESIG